MKLLSLAVGAALINNIVLAKFLGCCPFLGVSKNRKSAVGMGLAVIFVIFCSSLITYALYYLVLVPYKIEYMQLISFILVIAAFVQFVEMFLKKYSVSFEDGVSNINKNADIDITFTEDESTLNDVQTQTLFNEDVKQEQTDIPVETEKSKVIKDIPEFRLVGEAFKTYIFAELEGKLLLIDKHAAHERILFNKIKENASSTHQLLLQPAVVSLSAEEYDAVLDNVDVLADAGFEVSDFGNRTVKVASCPAELCDENIESLITEIAGYLAANIKTVVPEKLDWIYHSSACRAAVKAGNDTSIPEMEHLIKYLLEHDEIKCCPHGRPVAVEITKYELEKYFKRIV